MGAIENNSFGESDLAIVVVTGRANSDIQLQQRGFHNSGRKKRVEFSCTFEIKKIIAPADVFIVNKDLWDGTAAIGACDHLTFFVRIPTDVGFIELNTFLRQKTFSSVAEATK